MRDTFSASCSAVPKSIEKSGVLTPASPGRPEVGRKDGRVIHEMGSIRVLQPNVTPSEAVRLLSARGIAGALRSLLHGPLQRIADVYVPFWLYRVRYQMGPATESRFFALDAVQGALDLFEFPEVPEAARLVTIHTRNFLQSKLEAAQAEKLLREKALRVIFLEGFFKLRRAHLEVVREPIELHLPYWLGFCEGRARVHCRVLDAVRRRMEGAKASAFFENCLAA